MTMMPDVQRDWCSQTGPEAPRAYRPTVRPLGSFRTDPRALTVLLRANNGSDFKVHWHDRPHAEIQGTLCVQLAKQGIIPPEGDFESVACQLMDMGGGIIILQPVEASYAVLDPNTVFDIWPVLSIKDNTVGLPASPEETDIECK